jgi:inhibitor of KinA
LYLNDNVDTQILIQELTELYKTSSNNKTSSRTWKIPVCYDLCLGLDLQQLADSKPLSVEEVIQLHCQPLYHVYFLGFLPGFPYLGGLDSRLATPRLASPRVQIPKGSVAIGDHQTGVYPNESPGGWNIIGRTPIELFDVKRSTPTFIQAGDKVKFNPINLDEFNKLAEQIKNQCFNYEELKSD